MLAGGTFGVHCWWGAQREEAAHGAPLLPDCSSLKGRACACAPCGQGRRPFCVNGCSGLLAAAWCHWFMRGFRDRCSHTPAASPHSPAFRRRRWLAAHAKMGKSAPLRAFEAWMRAQGISWAESIDLVEGLPRCSGLALGITAVKDIEEGSLLCVIPKEACLSIRTTSIAALLEKEQLGGGELQRRVYFCWPGLSPGASGAGGHSAALTMQPPPAAACRPPPHSPTYPNWLLTPLPLAPLSTLPCISGLGLTIAVAYEAGIGAASKWCVCVRMCVRVCKSR